MVMLLSLGLLGCFDRTIPAGDPQRPDVVLISVDSLRADHLSSYGYSRPTSPFFDQLATEGVRFAHARSASPWTLPAHTTMLTGQLPSTHRVVEDGMAIDPSIPVLAEVMGAQGYATAGVVSTLYVSRMFGFDRGFDYFTDFEILTERSNRNNKITIEDVVDEAIKFVSKQSAGKPVFLFLHVYDVHYNYLPPEPYASRFDRPSNDDDPKYKNYFYFLENPLTAAQMTHQINQYDESILYVDDQFSRLGDALGRAGRAVQWVITSDHGEEFGERDTWGHAHTLYSEQLHIPLIMSGPGIPAGQVVEGWVGNHDIAPTIAGWAGAPGVLQAEGMDLAPILAGDITPPPRAFLAETSRFKTNKVSILEDDLRLEWNLNTDKAELYAPLSDMVEQTDLADARPEDVARLQERIQELLGQPWEASSPGTVQTEEFARVLQSGSHESLRVEPGARFQVLPYDAEVRFRESLPNGSKNHGPWQAHGGEHPTAEDPLALHSDQRTTGVEMDDATRAQLEALGYIQE